MNRYCDYCNDFSMTTDDGIDYYCSNGCRKCEAIGCTRKAEIDSDCCATCDLEELLREAGKAVAA